MDHVSCTQQGIIMKSSYKTWSTKNTNKCLSINTYYTDISYLMKIYLYIHIFIYCYIAILSYS